MKVVGERRLAHPRERVWAALLDPKVLARTLPGCRSLERDGDDAFTGLLQVSLGPVRGEFRGRLEMHDLVPPESYRMRLDGRGPSGFLTGEGSVRLEDDGSGDATVLHYDLEAQVGGRLAGLGQRLLESSGKAVASQGLDGLERQLAVMAGEGGADVEDASGTADEAATRAGAGEAPSRAAGTGAGAAAGEARPRSADPASASAAEPPSQVAFAVGVAREVFRDLVPQEARPFVYAGFGFLAGLLLGFGMGRRR